MTDDQRTLFTTSLTFLEAGLVELNAGIERYEKRRVEFVELRDKAQVKIDELRKLLSEGTVN